MDEYRVLERVGKGTFGRVYKAQHIRTSEIVALKVIPKKHKKEKELKSLRQEIGILRRLVHVNIISMWDAF